jgi:FKBP-type peptidyl-prolyl cis-trans isomerase
MRIITSVALATLVAAAACSKDSKDSNDEPAAEGVDTPAKPERQTKQPASAVPAPADVAAPPEEATRTDSGLAYLVLEKGSGTDKPGPNDVVQVEWTGWKSPTGTMFYTTTRRGQPVDISLGQASSGWREGLQDMVVGEKRRFWMTPELAYPERVKSAQTSEPVTLEVTLAGFKPAPEAPKHLTAPAPGAKKTESGVSYVILKPGTGDPIGAEDTAEIHLTVWDSTGRMFDSTRVREKTQTMQPAKAPDWLQEVILQLNKGASARGWVPADQVPKNLPGGPEGMLVYEVEVVDVKSPPKAPDDVAAPPKDAQKSPRGVFYKVLEKGDSDVHASVDKNFKAHYTGWTTDGKMFDSSVVKGRPIEFPLNQMIEGWKDAIPLMAIGDRFRLWIPEELAYKGQPGRPAGMLVFDVELLGVD